MSHNEFCFKREEDNTVIERQETIENYIENKAIIDFLIQHEPRKDLDLSKVKFPSYLYINEEEEEEEN